MSLQRFLDNHAFEGLFQSDMPLSQMTYFKIGGNAQNVVCPCSEKDLQTLSLYLKEHPCRFFTLGRGSNILAHDSGFNGILIRTHLLNSLWNLQKDTLEIAAGTMNSFVLNQCAHLGLSGLEFLAGIPGSIGGAVFMNAGNHLSECKDHVFSVKIYDMQTQSSEVISLTAKNFSYRKNHFLSPHQIILSVVFQMQKKDPQKIKDQIRETLERRKNTQPITFPSCGSVFKNPPGTKAWKVLDELGLRGVYENQAQFSEKHPNFIINHGKARAEDVKKLILMAKTQAKKILNIDLEEEVLYLE
jgi:UDP-N-acetylmuramate dehydrogenase